MSDLCRECGEHCTFNCCENSENGLECDESCMGEYISNCCGAPPYDPDPDYDMER